MSQLIDTDYIGSAGSLVTAGILTAGQYLQSRILDTFESAAPSVAYLLFMCSAVIAVWLTALGGKYKTTLWFIIGPCLFYSAITLRAQSNGVTWQLGNRIHSELLVKDSVQGLYGLKDKPVIGRVAWVYSMWDRVTGAMTNSAISALRIDKLRSDLDFISKTDRFAAIFQLRVEDGDVQRFLHTIAIDNCADYFALEQAYYDEARLMALGDVRTRLAEISKETRVIRGSEQWLMMSKMRTDGLFGTTPPAEKDEYTCPDLWEYSVAATKALATTAAIETAASSRLKEGGGPSELTVDESLADLAKKFCDDDVAADCAGKGTAQMINTISIRMIYRAIQERLPGFADAARQKHLLYPDNVISDKRETEFETERDFRILSGVEEYKGKGEYLSFILALPYLQGLAFFFLTVGYPFVCFFLIVPGRSKHFIHWLFLWFWIRSWDLGFAVVMMMDEVLYYLLPNGPAMTDNLVNQPGAAFKLVLQKDPSYSVNLYYVLMSTLIGAIPVLTAMAFKRGASDFIEVVGGGLRDFSGRIGGSVEAYMGSYRAHELVVHESERDKALSVEKAIPRMMQDPEVIGALGERMVSRFFGDLKTMSPGQAFGKLFGSLNKNHQNYVKGIFNKKMSAMGALEAYNFGVGPKNTRYAQDAVLMGWWTHDNADPFPTNDIQELVFTRANYMTGGPMDAALWALTKGGINAATKLSTQSILRNTGEAQFDIALRSAVAHPSVARAMGVQGVKSVQNAGGLAVDEFNTVYQSMAPSQQTRVMSALASRLQSMGFNRTP